MSLLQECRVEGRLADDGWWMTVDGTQKTDDSGRNSLISNPLELQSKPNNAIRRRFSGPLLLPPLARRHSTLDAKKLKDLEALYKSALACVDAQKEKE
ncbi:hypothetical protein DPX16_8872 [Anabarilius grahami]|uniref:Uncharacterized protein n=1 Tax=Anabarilius grahami TaxID=495550 RepID=A0A3N0YE81_ANAGA|nr:hypothetical protein DPX16_8872 [Anabarilius grahami]